MRYGSILRWSLLIFAALAILSTRPPCRPLRANSFLATSSRIFREVASSPGFAVALGLRPAFDFPPAPLRLLTLRFFVAFILFLAAGCWNDGRPGTADW